MCALNTFMDLALHEARLTALNSEVPVGALVVMNGHIISRCGNLTAYDATGHAELLAIRMAHIKLKSKLLIGCDLYTTLEPCSMCAGAISLARISRLYFGAYDEKYGAVHNEPRIFQYTNHRPEVYGGIMEQECSQLLKDFFQQLRLTAKVANK